MARGRRPAPRTAERACIDCGQVFPSTADYFPPGKGGKDASDYLYPYCRACKTKRQRAWRERSKAPEGGTRTLPDIRSKKRAAKQQIAPASSLYLIDEVLGVVRRVEVCSEMSLDHWRAMGADARQRIMKGAPIGIIRRRKGETS